jgi:hypothetical protein
MTGVMQMLGGRSRDSAGLAGVERWRPSLAAIVARLIVHVSQQRPALH